MKMSLFPKQTFQISGYFFYPQLLFLLGGLLSSSGCSKEYSTFDYFPTEKNISWVYSGYQNNWRLVNSDFIYIINNADKQKLEDNSELLKKTRHDGSVISYKINDQGIFTQTELMPDQLSPSEFTDTVLPNPIDKQKKWTKRIRTRLIPEFACGYCTTTTELKQPIELNYSVLSTDTTIETPLGEFENCILIEGKGFETIDAGDSMGNVEVQVHTREWYAPQTGLVKLIWREQTDEEILKIGEYRLELKEMYYN